MTTRTRPPLWRAVEQVMGMPVSVALRGEHAGTAEGIAAWAAVLAQLRAVDADLSPYRPDSWVSRVDRGEVGVSDCPRALVEVAAVGEAARTDSGGAFDVWRRDATGRLRFDPSGVVKGWAVQRVSRLLADLPDTDSCLSAGGDLVCHTAAADGLPWRVGIEDPHDPTRIVARVAVTRGAVATSGLSHRGGHVAHALTGALPRRLASVTVVAGDLTTADVDATSALALDGEGVAWLRSRRRTAVVVYAGGRVEVLGG